MERWAIRAGVSLRQAYVLRRGCLARRLAVTRAEIDRAYQLEMLCRHRTPQHRTFVRRDPNPLMNRLNAVYERSYRDVALTYLRKRLCDLDRGFALWERRVTAGTLVITEHQSVPGRIDTIRVGVGR